MIVRSRAWRRKKARGIIAKVTASKAWLNRQLDRMTDSSVRTPTKISIPHKPGKLSPAQELRNKWATQTEIRDGFAEI